MARLVRGFTRRLLGLVGVLGLCVAGATGTAQASILIVEGLSGGSGDVNNVLFKGDGAIDFGTLVAGFIKSTDILVVFEGNGIQLLDTPSSGQARIDGVLEEGGDYDPFTMIMFSLADAPAGMEKVQFFLNPVLPDGVDTGWITITAFNPMGQVSASFEVTGSGEKQYTILGEGDMSFTKILITSAGPLSFQDIRQIRIGPAGGEFDVPEPGALSLFLIALAGLTFGMRRRRAEQA